VGDLTRHFSRREFACRCGCGYDRIAGDLAFRLEVLRTRIGQPIYVNSGCRCEKHNAAVRGAKNSYHLRGMAADIHADLDPVELGRAAAESGWFRGIIVHAWGVHVDIRPGRKYWRL